MQFGHLDDISGIDFRLPADHSLTEGYLQGNNTVSPLELYIGVSRWNIPAWKGGWYPKGTKETLPVYASILNGIELNTTHYRIPTREQVEQWRKAVGGRNFLFSPKFPQVISHRGSLSADGQWTALFADTMQLFAEHLGHSFLQLPPTYGPDKINELLRFIDYMPTHFPYGIELRHTGWLQHPDRFAELMKAMHHRQVIPVFSDTAGHRDLLHMCLTAPAVIIRWLGNNGHATDSQRLQEWVHRLAQWHSMGLRRVYWFIHQHDDGQLSPTIHTLVSILKARFGVSFTLPAANGNQGSLF